MHKDIIVELSKRVQAINLPPLAVTARAARLKAEGRDIIWTGRWRTDFDTPQHIRMGQSSLSIKVNKYTAVGRRRASRTHYCKFKRDNGFDYNGGQSGFVRGKQAFST